MRTGTAHLASRGRGRLRRRSRTQGRCTAVLGSKIGKSPAFAVAGQLREKDRHPSRLSWPALCWAVPGAAALGSGLGTGRQQAGSVSPHTGESRAGGQPQRGGRGFGASCRSQAGGCLLRGRGSEQTCFIGAERGGWDGAGGEGSSHKGPQSLLLPPGQRFHCGGKKKRRWVLHGFKAASSLLPVLVPPAERAGFSTLPPASHTLPSVTRLPLLFAPQTRKRGRPVAAGRLQEDAPSWQPGSLGLPVLGSSASRPRCFREVPPRGFVSGGEELGHAGLRGRVTLPLRLLSELPRRRGSRASSEAEKSSPRAAPYPAPVDPLPRSPQARPECKLPSRFPLR